MADRLLLDHVREIVATLQEARREVGALQNEASKPIGPPAGQDMGGEGGRAAEYRTRVGRDTTLPPGLILNPQGQPVDSTGNVFGRTAPGPSAPPVAPGGGGQALGTGSDLPAPVQDADGHWLVPYKDATGQIQWSSTRFAGVARPSGAGGGGSFTGAGSSNPWTGGTIVGGFNPAGPPITIAGSSTSGAASSSGPVVQAVNDSGKATADTVSRAIRDGFRDLGQALAVVASGSAKLDLRRWRA